MTLGGTDLNLLLSLKVLLEEGNVTRAGQRLELSQPAMSAALARLRRRFDDELLVRAGRDYELTPLARDLLPEVQHAVRLMSRALHLEDEFDPAASDRTFRLSMSDYAIAVVHEPLLRLIGAAAPGVRLEIEGLGPGHPQLRQGAARLRRADRAARVRLPGRVPAAVAGPDGADGRPAAPAAGGRWLHASRTWPRCRTRSPASGRASSRPPTGPSASSASPGTSRSRSHGFLPLPFVIAGTEMVAVVPEKLARIHLRDDGPVVLVEPPFGEVVLAEGYWFGHDRLSDPAHRWLFARFDELGAELATGPIQLPYRELSYIYTYTSTHNITHT